MQTNSTQLKKLEFLVGDEDFTQLFQTLKAARPIHTINSLNVMFYFVRDSSLASPGLVDLCNNLKFLTHLTVKSDQSDNFGFVFFETLQELVTLEKLVVESFEIDYSQTESNRILFRKLKEWIEVS